jgi:hypothetical protein
MRLLAPALVLLVASSCLAQEARQVECRFLAFGSHKETASVIAVSDKGDDIPCPISSTQLSKKIVCSAKDNKIPFLSASDRKPLATATIPPGVRSALVIFVGLEAAGSKPTAEPGWRTFVIEDSPKSFPDGGAYVANFFTGDIRFVIGEHKGMLHAGGMHGYAMPTKLDDFNMAPVIFEFQSGEKWRIANESSLRFLPGMRYLIFTYMDPVSGRPKINTYQDLEDPKTAAAASGGARETE